MLTIHASLIKCAERLDRLIPKPFSDGYESSSSFTSNHVHLPISQSRNEVFVPEPDQVQVHKLAKELRQLVLLFDDLLIQEYSPEHLSMEYQDHADDNITCDSCPDSLPFLLYRWEDLQMRLDDTGAMSTF